MRKLDLCSLDVNKVVAEDRVFTFGQGTMYVHQTRAAEPKAGIADAEALVSGGTTLDPDAFKRTTIRPPAKTHNSLILAPSRAIPFDSANYLHPGENYCRQDDKNRRFVKPHVSTNHSGKFIHQPKNEAPQSELK